MTENPPLSPDRVFKDEAHPRLGKVVPGDCELDGGHSTAGEDRVDRMGRSAYDLSPRDVIPACDDGTAVIGARHPPRRRNCAAVDYDVFKRSCNRSGALSAAPTR